MTGPFESPRPVRRPPAFFVDCRFRLKVQCTHRSPAHCRGEVFCLPPHSLNFALCSRQLLCPVTDTTTLSSTMQSREGCSPYPFTHPTWLLLKKSLADRFLPLRCDRWQALVKTSYLRAPSTVGPFCLPVPHPPFPTPTIPVQSGNHASALSSSWSSLSHSPV